MSPPFPVSGEELAARHRAFARERTVASLLAWVPLLALYALTHTKYLRPYVPESKGAAVVMLVVVPFGWMLGVIFAHRALGPLRHGLKCPGCATRMVDGNYKAALQDGVCPQCQARIVTEAVSG